MPFDVHLDGVSVSVSDQDSAADMTATKYNPSHDNETTSRGLHSGTSTSMDAPFRLAGDRICYRTLDLSMSRLLD